MNVRAPEASEVVEEEEITIVRVVRRRVVTPAPSRHDGFAAALRDSTPLRAALAKLTRGTR